MALAHTAPRAERRAIHHRALALLGTLLIGAVVLGMVAAQFLWPTAPTTEFDMGRLDDFAPGTVTSFRLVDGEPYKLDPLTMRGMTREPGMHVVRLEDGELIVLSWRSPHLGWAARWVPDLPATAWLPELQGHPGGYDDGFSYWLMDGTRVFGPAPDNLDRFHVEITDTGRVRVDTSRVLKGERPAEFSHAGYPNPTSTPAGGPSNGR